METVQPENHWYEVRRGRILFYNDPTTPGVDRMGNVWAKPGQYVEASHPVLRAIIRGQTHKVRRLKDGDTIPVGSLICDARLNPAIKRLIDKYDGRNTDGGTRTPEEIVVGQAGGGAAPTISADPAADAKAKAEAAEVEAAAAKAKADAAAAEADAAAAVVEAEKAEAAAKAQEAVDAKAAADAAAAKEAADAQAAAEAAGGPGAVPVAEAGSPASEAAGA